MALQLEKSVFFHIPKTGGSWVRKALKQAGLSRGELGCNWHAGIQNLPNHICEHNKFHEVNCDGLFTFAFVRHPVSFYISYWCFKMKRGWTSNLDKRTQSEDFSIFVDKMIEDNDEGLVSHSYWRYLGLRIHLLDKIGRQEYLCEDLISILQYAGEFFDPDVIRSVAPTNVASQDPEWYQHVRLTSAIVQKIEQHEKWAMDALQYDSWEENVTAQHCRPIPLVHVTAAT